MAQQLSELGCGLLEGNLCPDLRETTARDADALQLGLLGVGTFSSKTVVRHPLGVRYSTSPAG